MNRASSPTGWVRNPTVKSPDLDPHLASSYELGWTWNPLTGCLNGCPYCYARRLANGRLRERYLLNGKTCDLYTRDVSVADATKHLLDPFYPRFWPERLAELCFRVSKRGKTIILHGRKPRGIFVCDMGELFGDWVPEDWTREVLANIKEDTQDRFYLLTKQPQNLAKWSPFPENCWVGVTMTKPDPTALIYLDEIEAKIRFISIEPMLAPWPEISFEEIPIDWLIIGACTGRGSEILRLCQKYPELTPMPYGKIWTAQPPIEHVQEIVEAASRAGIKVSLKDNLKPLFASTVTVNDEWVWAKDRGYGGLYRQEMPE